MGVTQCQCPHTAHVYGWAGKAANRGNPADTSTNSGQRTSNANQSRLAGDLATGAFHARCWLYHTLATFFFAFLFAFRTEDRHLIHDSLRSWELGNLGWIMNVRDPLPDGDRRCFRADWRNAKVPPSTP